MKNSQLLDLLHILLQKISVKSSHYERESLNVYATRLNPSQKLENKNGKWLPLTSQFV